MMKRLLRPIKVALTAVTIGLTLPGAQGQSQAVPFLEKTADEYCFNNADARLVIDRNAWRMRLVDTGRVVHYAEAEAPAFQIEGEWVALVKAGDAELRGDAAARLTGTLANGRPATVDVQAFGKSGFRVVMRAGSAGVTAVRGATMLGTVEEVYGFGEMWNGHVAQRGQAFDLWDRGGTPDECAYMPYYVSTGNYAFFLNYGGRVHFDVGQRRSDRLAFEAPAREFDITLVRGSSIASAVRHFLTIQGLPRRPPRWAYQPWFWLMGDPNRPGTDIDTLKGEHFVGMIKKLHELSIPVGVTWFEPPWQDARTSFVPNPGFSRDLKGLVHEIGELGVRTLAWTVPYTTSKASNWQEAVDRGYLARKPGAQTADGKVRISASGEAEGSNYTAIDFFNPDAFRWWQRQIEQSLETGIRGFKLDAGQDLPSDALLHGGRQGRDVRNSYALEYNRVFFESMEKHDGEDFLMVARAAWVGSSAYTSFKWPGDLSGSFANNGLPSSVYSSLSLAFCGIAFVSTDIGGFEDRPAPEDVWLRWAQFGAMLPGMQTLHMPWWYSPQALEHFRYLAWLHTDLTPMWMSLAHEAAVTGAPVCRPLVWTFQDDIDCWRVDDQFTVGHSLLVAPMLNSNPDREVYIPEGLWFDFWNEAETVRGPARVHWYKGSEARNKFPLYVRDGAIIPLEISNEVSGFGWPESTGFVTLALWPKIRGESEFVLHDTEGPVRLAVEWSQQDVLRVNWDSTRRNHLLRVHLNTSKVPTDVAAAAGPLPRLASLDSFRYGGEGWYYDQTGRNLWIRKMNSGSANTLSVNLEVLTHK